MLVQRRVMCHKLTVPKVWAITEIVRDRVTSPELVRG